MKNAKEILADIKRDNYGFSVRQALDYALKCIEDKSFYKWYVELIEYAEKKWPMKGASLVVRAGSDCWQESFNDDMTVEGAFEEGYRE